MLTHKHPLAGLAMGVYGASQCGASHIIGTREPCLSQLNM